MFTVLCVNGANVKQNYKVQEVNSILSYTRQTLDYYVVTWVLLVWKILCKMHNLNDYNEYTLLTYKIVCYLHKCYWSHLLSLVTRACRFKICFIQTFHSFTVILYFICTANWYGFWPRIFTLPCYFDIANNNFLEYLFISIFPTGLCRSHYVLVQSSKGEIWSLGTPNQSWRIHSSSK